MHATGNNVDQREYYEAKGYLQVRELPSGVLVGLQAFCFTTAIIVGLSEDGYEYRYCYEHRQEAEAAMQAWSGEGDPSGPWIKQKGRFIDRLNPNLAKEWDKV